MHQYTIQSILRHNQHQQKHTKNTHNIYKFTLYTEHPLTLWGWDTPETTVLGVPQPQRVNAQHIEIQTIYTREHKK